MGCHPQISAIFGPWRRRGAVYSPTLTDFIIMQKKETSNIFPHSGSEVMKTVTGEDVTQERLGGGATIFPWVGVARIRRRHTGGGDIELIKLISTYRRTTWRMLAGCLHGQDHPSGGFK